MNNRLYIAIDFDGTVVAHDYPLIGRSVGAEPVLKALVEAGHKLILFTMRHGTELAEAEEWFVRKGIEIWQVNRNPEQGRWTGSPKVWANIYIDDCAVGVPLRADFPDERPFVDWLRVRRWLVDNGVLDDSGEEDDENETASLSGV